jgi:hypothetical protein
MLSADDDIFLCFLGKQHSSKRLKVNFVFSIGDIKPERGQMETIHDYLVSAIDTCNLVEQNYSLIQEVGEAVILIEKLL